MNVILETERVILTVPQSADYPHLLQLRTDPEVMRCVGGFGQPFGAGEVQTKEQVQEHVRLAQEYYDNHGLGFFCAWEKNSQDFLGQAGLFHHSFDITQPLIELAYRFYRRYWGKGYATECANALIQWGLTVKKIPEIIAPIHPGNERSIRVLEKTPMIYSGTIQHKGHRLPCYSIKQGEDER